MGIIYINSFVFAPVEQIVTSGLVLHLDAGNPASYPGSGTTWFDLSGNNKNGLIAGPSFTALNGGSFIYDGVNDYSTISSPSPLVGTTFTFECWVYFSAITGDFGGLRKCAWLFAGGTGSGSGQPEFGVLSQNNSSTTPSLIIFGAGAGQGTGSCSANVTSIITNGSWNQIVLVKSSSNSQIIYVNANQIGTGNHSHAYVNGVTAFGAIPFNNPSYDGFLNGQLPNIRIYNRALTLAEVTQNYNATCQRFGLSPIPSIVTEGLVLHLDAGDPASYPGSGTTWADLSGNGNDGTLVNDVGYDSANGGTLVFDGNDDYVSETSSLSDGFWQGNWTASFWVNFDTVNTGNFFSDRPLLQHGFSSTRNGLHLTQRNSRIHYGLYSDDLEGTNILNTGTWYNVVFTLNNSTYAKQIYLNNVLDNSHIGGGAYTGTGTNTRIAGRALNFGLFFDGFMSNCIFYNRVLTAQEIQQNFNATRGRFGI